MFNEINHTRDRLENLVREELGSEEEESLVITGKEEEEETTLEVEETNYDQFPISQNEEVDIQADTRDLKKKIKWLTGVDDQSLILLAQRILLISSQTEALEVFAEHFSFGLKFRLLHLDLFSRFSSLLCFL